MKTLHGKMETMSDTNQADRDKILDLQSKYKSEQAQRLMVEEKFSEAKHELATSLTALNRAEGELRELQKKLVAMEQEMGALSNHNSLNKAELRASQVRETELKKEIQHTAEVPRILLMIVILWSEWPSPLFS